MKKNGPKSQDLEKDEAGETRENETQQEAPTGTPCLPATEPNILDVKYALAMTRAINSSQPESGDEDKNEAIEKSEELDEDYEMAKEKVRATWVSRPTGPLLVTLESGNAATSSSNIDNSTIRPGVIYQRHALGETATESVEAAVCAMEIIRPPTHPLAKQPSAGTTIPEAEMANITTAHLVEEDPHEIAAAANVDQTALMVLARPEPKPDHHALYWSIVVVLLAITLVVTASLLATRRGQSGSSDKGGALQLQPREIAYYAFNSTEELYDAVDEYLLALQTNEGNETNIITPLAQLNVSLTYGFPIGTWDVSRLTNFSRVFDPDRTAALEPFRFLIDVSSTFNEDLGGWDVSNAVTMRGMFACAVNFRGHGLGHWNVGRVQDFSYMMYRGQAFDADVSAWSTSSAITMEAMMFGALVFNGNVTMWDVSNVESMAHMFSQALQFQGGDLRQWNVSKVQDMSELFALDWAFSGNVSTWDTSRVATFFNMVRIVVSLRE
jgi:Mycoplasma protein of unknown function, DUF285